MKAALKLSALAVVMRVVRAEEVDIFDWAMASMAASWKNIPRINRPIPIRPIPLLGFVLSVMAHASLLADWTPLAFESRSL